jgi:hypothetical protein
MLLIIHNAMQKECNSSTTYSLHIEAAPLSVFCEQQYATSKVSYCYPKTDSSYNHPVTESSQVYNPGTSSLMGQLKLIVH